MTCIQIQIVAWVESGSDKSDCMRQRFIIVYVPCNDFGNDAGKANIHPPYHRAKTLQGKRLNCNRLAVNRENARRIDQIAMDQYRIPSILLMENAGRGSAETIHHLYPSGGISILCGSGNNAGDGYVIARHLQTFGREVQIISLVDRDRLIGDAKTNSDIAHASCIPIVFAQNREETASFLTNTKIIVDAMLGTGSQGAPRTKIADAIRVSNETSAARIAIDLPSGLDCDTGLASDPTFQADHTLTFVAEKIGFKKNNADGYTGAVSIIDIGVPQKLLNDFFVSGNRWG